METIVLKENTNSKERDDVYQLRLVIGQPEGKLPAIYLHDTAKGDIQAVSNITQNQCPLTFIFRDVQESTPAQNGQSDEDAKKLWELSVQLVHLKQEETHPQLHWCGFKKTQTKSNCVTYLHM